MKMLFKAFLLSQLIALPFAVGALNHMLKSSSPPPVIDDPIVAAEATAVTRDDLCDSLQGSSNSTVQDDIEQLKFLTGELYGDEKAGDCFPGNSLTSTSTGYLPSP